MELPLAGVRVIDWTVYQQGPIGTLMLADLGAEVIKLEEKGRGDLSRQVGAWMGMPVQLDGGRSFYYEVYNYNKLGIALDLKKEGAREVVYRLVEKSDVFALNLREEAARRFGLDYESLSRVNPRLIYAQASGYGPKGPHRSRPAVDPAIAARSGIIASLTPKGAQEPHYPSMAIVDQIGAVMLAYGVLSALIARDKTGRGMRMDVSLLSSAMWLEALHINSHLMLGKDLSRFVRHRATNPLVNFYCCADGGWLYLHLADSERHWADFCQALGLGELEHHPQFAAPTARAQNREELVSIIEQAFAQKPLREWLSILGQYPDFIFDPVQPVTALAQDPQVVANEFLAEFPHPALGKLKVVAAPLKFNRESLPVRRPAPELGQHNEEVLGRVAGYSPQEIARLREDGVI